MLIYIAFYYNPTKDWDVECEYDISVTTEKESVVKKHFYIHISLYMLIYMQLLSLHFNQNNPNFI